ncbi:hypothetical protein GQ53DRAFT_832990 [Thozetella sp. PMI_491]|nr:hypothetical protein GQ53DRAFT_832990 [Thozetella sp. PMI_491]
MAKILATLFATVAVFASAMAAQPPCPANGQFCGSELLDVYQCTNATYLRSITPPEPNGDRVITTWIYPTDGNGTPQIPFGDCIQTGCANAGPGGSPPAHCN